MLSFEGRLAADLTASLVSNLFQSDVIIVVCILQNSWLNGICSVKV